MGKHVDVDDHEYVDVDVDDYEHEYVDVDDHAKDKGPTDVATSAGPLS